MKQSYKTIRLALACLLATVVLATGVDTPALYAAPATQISTATTTIKIPAPEEAKGFGAAIAYDGQTLVATAPQTDVDGTTEQGMAYIYAVDPDDPQNWQLQATATFTTPIEHGWLGDSVAVAGDTIVIGAPYVGAPSTTQNGAILIVERTPEDPTWRVTQFERNLHHDSEDGTTSTMGAFANFGESVAIDQGENARILVGAPGADIYALNENDFPVLRDNAGGVFVFWRQSDQPGSWQAHPMPGVTKGFAALTDERGEFNSLFGEAVASDTQGGIVNTIIGSPMADVYELYDNAGKAVQFRSVPDNPLAERLNPEIHRGMNSGGGLFGGAVDLQSDVVVIGSRATDYKLSDDVSISSTGAAMIKGVVPSSIPTLVYASDYQEYAYFGTAVSVHQKVVAIGAPGYTHFDFMEWGAVYRFEEDDAGEWAEVAKYVIQEMDGGGALGQSVEVYEGLVLAGAPGANGGIGAVYIFDDGPLPEEPSEEEPMGEVPDNLEHLAGTPTDEEPTDEEPHNYPYTLLLPATSYQVSETETPDNEPPADLLPAVQLLQNGNSVQSNYGARLGALEGTLVESRDSYIVAVSPPITLPHESLTVVGHYYAMGTITSSVIAPPEQPFIVGLPVPDGVNPAELAAALFIPNNDSNDHANGEGSEWVTVPGAYDAETKLFSFTMSKLSKEWLLAVLVTNPNHIQIEPPEAMTQGQDAADVSVTRFLIRCTARVPATHPLCAESLRNEIEAEFINAYHDFMGQGFRAPSLKSEFPYFDAASPKPGMVPTLQYYGIIIHPAPCPEPGLFRPGLHIIKLCVDPAVGADIPLVEVIRHELFHAIQYSYPEIRANWDNAHDWVIEGTAAAAQRSSETMFHTPNLSAREIDVKLNRPLLPPEVYPYQVQDFWVYVGQRLGVSLGYLTSIFEAGSKPADVDDALGDTLESAYWGWVTHQVYEKDLGPQYRFSFQPCQLEMSLVWETSIGLNQSSTFPFTLTEMLEALNATTYAIEFQQDMGYVSVELQRSGPGTYFKMYKHGEGGCVNVPELVGRDFEANAGDIIYVVVANTDYRHAEVHKLVVSAGGE